MTKSFHNLRLSGTLVYPSSRHVPIMINDLDLDYDHTVTHHNAVLLPDHNYFEGLGANTR